MKINLLLMAMGLCTTCVTAQTLPKVTTDTRYARGATSAYGRMTVVTNGNSIKERGFCWATHPQPTAAENKTTNYFSNQGNIYRLEDLEPATIYYMSAYVVTTKGDSVYGEDIKMSTLPMGTITYSYDRGAGDKTVDDRIENAVKGAVEYWNRLTNITGFSTSVHWGAQTPTADCSYGGWMRIGPNASYQRIGTVMHEMLHGIGVGTHWLWYGPSYMRANSTRGAWLGDRAQDLIRFWDNNDTAILNGDGTHLWPYGINGAHEDNGTEQLYTITSLVAQAVGEDGLPCSNQRGYASPYYSFVQEDTVKYYLKSESKDYGLYNSFLIETANGRISWQARSSEQVLSNDSCAWYICFTPSNQYYQLRNAATGHYLTYVTSGNNGIRTADRTNGPLVNDNFHLMPARQETVIGRGVDQQRVRGYWIIHPTASTASPATLTAAAGGLTTTKGFDLSNEAVQQRWLLLTAEQAQLTELMGQDEGQNKLSKTLADIRAMIQVPHQQTTEQDADQLLIATLSEIEDKAKGASVVALDSLQVLAQQAANTFLLSVLPTDMAQPFELTFRIQRPDFVGNSITGWQCTINPTVDYECVEFYQQKADLYQLLDNMPAGTYELRLKGLARSGSTSTVWSTYRLLGNSRTTCYAYLGTGTSSTTRTKTRMMNIAECRQPNQLSTSDVQVGDSMWVPNTMAGAAKYFAQGLYQNSIMRQITEAQLTKSGGQMRIGVYDDPTNDFSWDIFTDVHIFYYGSLSIDDITAISDVRQDQLGSTARLGVYNLSGRRVGNSLQGLAPGLYIYNGKKVVVRGER